MNSSLRLSDLLMRRLSLQWYEAIAIVRSVAEPLLDHQGAGMPIPEPHQIALCADGSVTLAGGVLDVLQVRDREGRHGDGSPDLGVGGTAYFARGSIAA